MSHVTMFSVVYLVKQLFDIKDLYTFSILYYNSVGNFLVMISTNVLPIGGNLCFTVIYSL
jgi:hypothetical protein